MKRLVLQLCFKLVHPANMAFISPHHHTDPEVKRTENESCNSVTQFYPLQERCDTASEWEAKEVRVKILRPIRERNDHTHLFQSYPGSALSCPLFVSIIPFYFPGGKREIWPFGQDFLASGLGSREWINSHTWAVPFIAQMVCACTINSAAAQTLLQCVRLTTVHSAHSHTSYCEILHRNTTSLISLDL